MLGNPQKDGDIFYSNVELDDEISGVIKISKEGEYYIGDIQDNIDTSNIEKKIIERLKSQAQDWFTISPDLIPEIFQKSEKKVRFEFDDDIDYTLLDMNALYEVSLKAKKVLIYSDKLLLLYVCNDINDLYQEDEEDINQEFPKENLNLLSNVENNSIEDNMRIPDMEELNIQEIRTIDNLETNDIEQKMKIINEMRIQANLLQMKANEMEYSLFKNKKYK